MEQNSHTSFRVLVSGRVQGVGFRQATRQVAEDCGVVGWVRNLEDGRVEAFVKGPKESVEKMLEFFQRGPRSANVTDCLVSSLVEAGEAYEDFSILR